MDAHAIHRPDMFAATGRAAAERPRRYGRPFRISLIVHAGVVGSALLLSVLQGCLGRHLPSVTPIEFTVAAETSPTVRDRPDPGPATPSPPPVRPRPRPQAPADPLPPAPVAPDLVPDPAPAPRPPQDAIRLAQPAPLPATPRNERPKVERSVVKVFRGPPNPGVRQTLSTEEIRRRILDGARLGAVDTLPPSELERNYLQIRRVLYEAWMQPSAGEAGSQPAEMEIRLDASGNVVGSRLIATSGSAVFDQTVQSAVQSVRRIQGLSASFARQNPRVTVEFRLEP